MTKEDALKLSEILKLYSEGKPLQWRLKGHLNWEDISSDWNFENNIDKIEYRVKQKIEHRPYSNAELFLKDLKKHGPYIKLRNTNSYYLPIIIGTDWPNNELSIKINNAIIVISELAKNYEWQDGHPCRNLID